MTVKEAFSKAFGEVPEGATCHVGSHNERNDCQYVEATVGVSGIIATRWQNGTWEIPYEDSAEYDSPFGPDISDRDAHAFRGFFGAEYDAVLDADQKENANED